MKTILLDGNWTMFSDSAPECRIPACLPGDNYTALIQAGLCPYPYYGKNELAVQKFRYEQWNWERNFSVPAAVYASEFIYLELSMVDTFCTIYINDQEVCGCSNAYAAYRPEIKRHL